MRNITTLKVEKRHTSGTFSKDYYQKDSIKRKSNVRGEFSNNIREREFFDRMYHAFSSEAC